MKAGKRSASIGGILGIRVLTKVTIPLSTSGRIVEIFATKLPADSTSPVMASLIALSSPEANAPSVLVQAALVEASEPEIVEAASLAVVPAIFISTCVA